METGEAACDPRSYVALLKELCEEYKLPAAEFELVGDTGPPHLRHFTMRARVGQLDRCATATAKKTARQIAAQQLYCYLRENLASLTADFVEEDALVRVVDKAKERYVDLDSDAPWRPDLSQKISEYHLGLTSQIEDNALAAAATVLREARDSSPERALAAAVQALGLRLEYGALEPLSVVQLTPTSPALAFAGDSRDEAARAALRYVRAALAFARAPPHSPPHSPAHSAAHSPAHSTAHTPALAFAPGPSTSTNFAGVDCF
ncbi:hypothetical protein O3G_MSEX013312 [Manduca sexta]|uniref:DRBM domain-containing protein n=2 Tax=Manduca sexta TaxID=7130 RepID=A0A921ZRW5_MANSE|nr:hypothetical protein O3G_MSEX013312 [Manduca sexta]